MSSGEKVPMRFRHVYMGIGTILVILIWLLTDPDAGLIQSMPFGSGLIATIVILTKTVLYATALHFTRKGLLDYIDLKTYFDKALQTSDGAGRALTAVGLIMIAIAIIIMAAVSN